MRDIAEVKKDFLEHIPEQNYVIAGTVFNLMTVILSGADLDFDKVMEKLPQDVMGLFPICAFNGDE